MIDPTRFTMIHHVDQNTIEGMYRDYPAVFILTTGRSGSKFITLLLGSSTELEALHEPQPTLQYFANFAFHNQNQIEVLKYLVDAARMERLLETMISGKIYVESNQCLTFFAPVLAGLYRSSRFVHLVRHPGDFVASAIRKGWHRNDSIWESGRVRAADASSWNAFDHVEKLAWVWDATNTFVEKFKQNLDPARVLTLRMEDLAAGEPFESLLHFCGATTFDREHVKAIQRTRVNQLVVAPNEPLNMRKNPAFPSYSEWSEDWKDMLVNMCAAGALRYGYQL